MGRRAVKIEQEPGMNSIRNAPCICGSGKKFKKCCEKKKKLRSANPSDEEFGQLVSLYNLGHYVELERGSRSLIKRFPGSGLAWKLLSVALLMQGKTALPEFQKAAILMPNDAQVHFNLGSVLKNLGRFEEAIACFQKALQINPTYSEALNNMGNAQSDLGQLNDAVDSFSRVLKITPNSEVAHNNMGVALKQLGKTDKAVEGFNCALKINPNYVEAINNLGNAQIDSGKLSDAVDCFKRVLTIDPNNAAAYCNLGNAQVELGELNEAVDCFRHTLAINPKFSTALNNLANAQCDLGQLSNAIESIRQALEMDPDFTAAFSSLLFLQNYSAAHVSPSFLEEAHQYGRMVAKKVASPFASWQCEVSPERLRVGIVSGDLCAHPVGYFLEGLLAQIDPTKIELIAYPTHPQFDELTDRIKPLFSSYKPLFGQSDQAAAERIHGDAVHILIDLSGHSIHNRLPVFAWKPAPVQVSWLGYFATTGVKEIDYLLADKVCVPEARHGDFSEAIWYLPDTRLCFTPPERDSAVAALPALKNGFITFGCFQVLAKVSDDVLEAWAKILSTLPNARLRWQCKQFGSPDVLEQVSQRLQQRGINLERVDMFGAVSREAYLMAHAEVDMILDTFPYPGGTTTCEALWMGVPTLTLAGETLLAKQGESINIVSGLNDWVVSSTTDYIDRAVTLASDLPLLAALRSELREKISLSPLFDSARFARNLEDALWEMWQAQAKKSSDA